MEQVSHQTSEIFPIVCHFPVLIVYCTSHTEFNLLVVSLECALFSFFYAKGNLWTRLVQGRKKSPFFFFSNTINTIKLITVALLCYSCFTLEWKIFSLMWTDKKLFLTLKTFPLHSWLYKDLYENIHTFGLLYINNHKIFFSKNGDKWSLYVYLLPIFKQVAFTVGSVCLIPSFSKKN